MVASIHVAYFMASGVVSGGAVSANDTKCLSIGDNIEPRNSTGITRFRKEKTNISTHSDVIIDATYKIKSLLK